MKSRHAVLHGILIPLLWYAVYLAASTAGYFAMKPFLGSWSQLAGELLIQLPIASVTVVLLRKRNPERTVALRKSRFAAFTVLFALLACVPTQLLMHRGASAASGTNGVTVLLNLVIVAPVLEETAFRGAVFALSRNALGFWPAAIFSTLVFASAHDGIGYLPAVVPVALCSAALCDATGKLRYGMILHFVFNLFSILLVSVSVPAALAIPAYAAGTAAVILFCAKRHAFVRAAAGPAAVA